MVVSEKVSFKEAALADRLDFVPQNEPTTQAHNAPQSTFVG